MTTTTTISCPAGAWTQVSTGSASVTVQAAAFGFRIAIGSAAPATTTSGVFVAEQDGTFAASSLAGSDNVYVCPVGLIAITAQVLAS